MDYQDFVLQIDRAPGERGFITRVIRSPDAGEAEAPFVNPVSAEELARMWRVASKTRSAERTDTREVWTNSSSSTADPLAAVLSLQDLGDRLFQALFPGPVHSCWVHSLAELERNPDGGLRLKLQLNLEDSALAPLAELPWEYLYSREHGGFLGLHRQTPILRHLRLPLPVGRAPLARPLRVLIVSSQPDALPRLALEEESEKIATILGTLKGVETLALHNPSIETLRETLLERHFHVLHFMGHGGFDPKNGQGVLYFTDRCGGAVSVGGGLLASHLGGLPSLRLVFLNACETARANERAPFAGVATALLQVGLPAVIAMQQPIRDGSALEFSRTVYRRLAAGDPIDAAVTEGRLAIARGHGALLEWGTPVLFMRTEDGQIFAREPDAASVPEPAETSPPPQRARRSRILYPALLAFALVISLGRGVLRWPFAPERQSEPVEESGPLAAESTVTDTSGLMSAPPPQSLPGKKEENLVLRPEPSPEKPPERGAPSKPAQKPAFSKPNREIELEKPPSPSSADHSFEVRQGGPLFIPDLEAEVGVYFFERAGRSLARFWVIPRGQGKLEQPPVLGPGSIEFPAKDGTGTYHLEVLSLAEGSATVRLRFVP